MKKFVQVIALIAVAGLLWSGVPSEEAIAVSGCCMQRPDVNATWRYIHKDFAMCKTQNEPDHDNIFEPVGEIWWDVGC